MGYAVGNLSMLIVGTGKGFLLVTMDVTAIALLLSLEQLRLYISVATVDTLDFSREEPVLLES